MVSKYRWESKRIWKLKNKKPLKIFTITFIITFLLMFILDMPTVKNYIKSQIRQAKILSLKAKYNVKPEGLNS